MPENGGHVLHGQQNKIHVGWYHATLTCRMYLHTL